MRSLSRYTAQPPAETNIISRKKSQKSQKVKAGLGTEKHDLVNLLFYVFCAFLRPFEKMKKESNRLF